MAAQANPLIVMKKYLTVGYAYPVYFLLILGQCFLVEGLDSLYSPSVQDSTIAQPVYRTISALETAPTNGKEARTAFASPKKTHEKGR